MVAGVVTVGRSRYAVGLYWENSPGGGRVTQIAKEAARQPGQQADFYVVRPGNKDGRIPQFGLSGSEAGQEAGMPALAACIANQVPGSWAGAFRLNEGTVVIVVRDDLIVPDGDLFFTDEASARDRLIQEVGFGGLLSVYAPESWSIPGADTIPVTLLLSDRTDIQLQRVSLPKKVKIAAAAAVVLFILALGGLWLYQENIDAENTRMAQQQEALRRAQQKGLLPSMMQSQQPPEPKYERKWETSPVALDVVQACQQGLSRIPVAVVGWKMTALTCSGSSFAITWTRDKGQSVPPPGSVVNDSVTSATQTVPLTELPPRGAESLSNPDDITKRYLIQNWPTALARVPDEPPPPPPPGYTGPWNPPPPPWVKRSFTFAVPELPGNLPYWLGGLPGVVITNVVATGTTANSWTIGGIIYENRR